MHFVHMNNLWSNFMMKAELGNKRICNSCNTKFYDLNKEVPICPKCGAEYIIKVKPRLGRPPLNKNNNTIKNVKEDPIKKSPDENTPDTDNEDIIENEIENLISIEDIDENVIDSDGQLDIENTDEQENNISEIANINIEDKEEDTDL